MEETEKTSPCTHWHTHVFMTIILSIAYNTKSLTQCYSSSSNTSYFIQTEIFNIYLDLSLRQIRLVFIKRNIIITRWPVSCSARSHMCITLTNDDTFSVSTSQHSLRTQYSKGSWASWKHSTPWTRVLTRRCATSSQP